MAGKPWTDTDQQRLLDLHADGRSLHAIAKELGRSKDTISRYAAAAGLTWDRSRTAAAAHAVVVDNKARRAEALRRELDILELAQKRILDGHHGRGWRTLLRGEAGREYEQRLDFVPARDHRDETSSRNSMVAMIVKLEALDSDQRDLPAVDQWLAFMTGKIVDASGPPNGATSEGPSDSPS